MINELNILILTAISVAFFHTLFGPDHYIPFIAMSKAGKWSTIKTLWVTILCGIGHVGSSVILGFLGIGLGIAVAHLQKVESIRGNIAGWILIVFGLLYSAWGIYRAYQNKPHSHLHPHIDGSIHDHAHSHAENHVHAHLADNKPTMTLWILFTIFVFGPCEPLIPILMYPASQGHIFNVVIVALIFGIITIGMMVSIVLGAVLGLRQLPTVHLERYSHALAGITILLCGIAVQFLGL